MGAQRDVGALAMANLCFGVNFYFIVDNNGIE